MIGVVHEPVARPATRTTTVHIGRPPATLPLVRSLALFAPLAPATQEALARRQTALSFRRRGDGTTEIHARISGDKFSGRMSIKVSDARHTINIVQFNAKSGIYRLATSLTLER